MSLPQLSSDLMNTIGVVLELLVAGLSAFLVAVWISLGLWTFRDIRARTRDVFAWLLAVVLVLATFGLGLPLYWLLRPRETLAEAYDRQLEEEALLRDITARRACPTCQTVTEPDWLVCPRCRTQLRRTCEHCQRPLELDWVACPYCAAPVGSNGTEGKVPTLRTPPMWEPEPEPEMEPLSPAPRAATPAE